MVIRFCTRRAAENRVRGQVFTWISLPVVAVGVLLLGVGTYGAWRVYGLQKRGSDIVSVNVAGIRVTEELETVVREMRYRLKRLRETGEHHHLELIVQRLPAGERWLKEVEGLAATTREQQLIERVRRGYDRFREDFEEILQDPEASESSRMALKLADEVIPNKILLYSNRFIQLNEDELNRSSEHNQSTANHLMVGLLLLGSCGGVAGLLAGVMIARRVSHTIVQLSLPIRDAAGKLNEVVGPVSLSADPGIEDLPRVLQTVSEHVSTVVERLHERERETLRAEQLAALGQLAAGLAHELRNPLTAAKTVLQLAETPSELSPRDLEVLKQEVGRLEQSIQTFLDFARPPFPEKREMDLGHLIRQTVDLVSRRAERQQIRLDCSIPPHPLPMVADATQLRQVLLNLLLNAFDAAPAHGLVRIEARIEQAALSDDSSFCNHHEPGQNDELRNEESRRSMIGIRVIDNGSGLPGNLGERIFEPFISTKETGTGLGLSICKRIVEAHGGRIDAATRPQGGTVFTVLLPADVPMPTSGNVVRSGVMAGRESEPEVTPERRDAGVPETASLAMRSGG
jgi:two-component system, NtrC family, sensor histidine kinase HydH